MKTILTIVFFNFFLTANAQFFADTTRGEVPAIITFTDTSGAISWLWDFGDGFTGQTNPCTHPYMQNGVYTVTCKVRFPDGKKKIYTKTDYINIGNCNTAVLTNANEINVYLCQNITNNAIRLKIACKFNVFSLNGEKLKSGFGESVDLSSFANGMYIIQINGKSFKIIKNGR